MPIPYQYRIREVAALLDTPATALRYWEKEFGVRPQRTPAGQRRYTETDVARLRVIKTLLHERRLTIEATKAYLAESNDKNTHITCRNNEEAIALLEQLREAVYDSPKAQKIINKLQKFIVKNST